MEFQWYLDIVVLTQILRITYQCKQLIRLSQKIVLESNGVVHPKDPAVEENALQQSIVNSQSVDDQNEYSIIEIVICNEYEIRDIIFGYLLPDDSTVIGNSSNSDIPDSSGLHTRNKTFPPGSVHCPFNDCQSTAIHVKAIANHLRSAHSPASLATLTSRKLHSAEIVIIVMCIIYVVVFQSSWSM